uniref:16S rRNA (cytosine(1402)-N(4))-methyltransferase n=1 Tax=Candidatus Planktophila sp. TaxID=2175601 RepID=UPI00404B8443
QATTSGTPRDLPIDLPEFAAKFALVVRGSVLPSEAEIAANSRAQSVRLRAIERLAA